MKKTLVLLAIVTLVVGCESAYDLEQHNQLTRNAEKFALAYQQRRENLVASFKEAYPDNWEEKLLEYRLQQDTLQRQQQAFAQQQELIRQQQTKQNWQNSWFNFWQNYSQQQQNLTYQQNMQLRENAREINRQLQSRRPTHIIIDDY